MLGVSIILPVLPILAKEFEVGSSELGTCFQIDTRSHTKKHTHTYTYRIHFCGVRCGTNDLDAYFWKTFG